MNRYYINKPADMRSGSCLSASCLAAVCVRTLGEKMGEVGDLNCLSLLKEERRWEKGKHELCN